jgi:hypothetical protein
MRRQRNAGIVVGNGGAERTSLKNNFSKSDTVLLVYEVEGTPRCFVVGESQKRDLQVMLRSLPRIRRQSMWDAARFTEADPNYTGETRLHESRSSFWKRRKLIQLGGTISGILATLWYPTTVRVVQTRTPKTTTRQSHTGPRPDFD